MRRGYRILHGDGESASARYTVDTQRVLSEAEKELLHLLKTRGISSICESISKEINYAWAVTSGFRALGNAGNFYFACAGQILGYNPGHDFFTWGGMQLAVFALHKFLHNETVLLPVLECIYIYTKLHVDGAIDFLAVDEAKEILMKCIRFHDNKHSIITATCQALGSLVMNDLVKESVSTPGLTVELLGLLKRYASSQRICRAALVPLGFLVTDAQIAEVFIDNSGISVVMTTMKNFVGDVEVVWHTLGVLNAVNCKVLDVRLIYVICNFTGIPRIVEALALHLDTEEIAVEGFRLLSRLAMIPDAYRIVNNCKVLDLAYVALFAYSGPQHRHTRMEISKTLCSFQKCTLHDPKELSMREQASRRDILFYALFIFTLLLTSALSPFTASSVAATMLQRSIEQAPWIQIHESEKHTRKILRDVTRIDDVWSYLHGPLYRMLFATSWYNGDSFLSDVDTQVGMVIGPSRLIGGVQLRMLRVRNFTTCAPNTRHCYPPYEPKQELKSSLVKSNGTVDRWSAAPNSDASSKSFQGLLARYPETGYRIFVPRFSKTNVADACGPKCILERLKNANWIDESSRALFVEFNIFNPVEDVHGSVTVLFEFSPAGGVLTSTRITPIVMNRYGGLFVFSALFYVELALLGGLTWQLRKQIEKIQRYRFFYFMVPSHLADFLIIMLWTATITSRLRFHVVTSHAQFDALAAEASFVSIETDAQLQRQELEMTASCAFLMWWRMLELTRRLKPVEQTFAKIERAEALAKSYFVLLVIHVLAFGHTGSLVFRTHSSGFSSFGASMVTTLKSLALGCDESDSDSSDHVRLWGVLVRLNSLFVVMNLMVSILRERFEFRLLDKQPTVVPDGLSILELAKRQLKMNGQPTDPVSLPSRLRSAASRGLDWIQETTYRLSTTNDPVQLTELKTVWGLGGKDDSKVQTGVLLAHNSNVLERLLLEAEDEDRLLDERLSRMHAHCLELVQCLEVVEQLRQERRDALVTRNNRLRGAHTAMRCVNNVADGSPV